MNFLKRLFGKKMSKDPGDDNQQGGVQPVEPKVEEGAAPTEETPEQPE